MDKDKEGISTRLWLASDRQLMFRSEFQAGDYLWSLYWEVPNGPKAKAEDVHLVMAKRWRGGNWTTDWSSDSRSHTKKSDIPNQRESVRRVIEATAKVFEAFQDVSLGAAYVVAVSLRNQNEVAMDTLKRILREMCENGVPDDNDDLWNLIGACAKADELNNKYDKIQDVLGASPLYNRRELQNPVF